MFDLPSLQNVKRGPLTEPHAIFLLGVPGVGKSTFCAGAPSPIFLDTEGSTGHLDVARWSIGSLDDATEALTVLDRERHDFRTLVIDTTDALEALVQAKVLMGTDQTINEYKGGFGKGNDASLKEWRKILDACFALRAKHGMHLIFTGHVQIKSFKNPIGLDFDRYIAKLSDKSGSLIREACAHVLFARYEVLTTKNDADKRVRGVSNGTRVVHTEWSAAWDAKNRADLPPELPLSWDAFAAAASAASPERLDALGREADTVVAQLSPDRRAGAEAAVVKAKTARRAGDLAKIIDRARVILETTTSNQVNADNKGASQ